MIKAVRTHKSNYPPHLLTRLRQEPDDNEDLKVFTRPPMESRRLTAATFDRVRLPFRAQRLLCAGEKPDLRWRW